MLNHLNQGITEEDVRVIRLIYIAMGMGATFFSGVIAVLSILSAQRDVMPQESDARAILILLYALLVFACVLYPVAGYLFKKILRGQDGSNPLSAKVRSSYLVRIALYEAAAFFGLIIGLFAGTNGVFKNHPHYLVSFAPYFILLGLIIKTFPSKQSLEAHAHDVPFA